MRKYHFVSKIAIYLLSVVLICFGIFHFMYPHHLLVYVPTFLPAAVSWAYVVGACFILTGISFITNRYVKFTAYLLAFWLVFFIVTIHVPNALNAGAPDMRLAAWINVLKDTAIVGFALHIAAGAYHQHFHLENSD
jgi:putative oxidoreductase